MSGSHYIPDMRNCLVCDKRFHCNTRSKRKTCSKKCSINYHNHIYPKEHKKERQDYMREYRKLSYVKEKISIQKKKHNQIPEIKENNKQYAKRYYQQKKHT